MLEVDPTEFASLLDNSRRKGVVWERPGHASFFANGALMFESPVGVRIHGGLSRHAGTSQMSLRLYFTQSRQAWSPPGPLIGFERARLHKTLVLHGDERQHLGTGEWHYVNPIAYDVARRLGVLAPETTPTTLVVNGADPRPYVLTEYLDFDFLESRFGSRDFDLFDTKDVARRPRPTEGPIAELRIRFGESENWTLDRIGQVVDLDNLSGWFLTALFCGTNDAWQGPLLRNRSRAEAKWFWAAWDLDLSFGRPVPVYEFPDPAWAFDQFLEIFGQDPKRQGRTRDERALLLRHLFSTSPEFRRSFADLFVSVRDHVLTPGFWDETLSKYESAAAINHVADRAYQTKIREYIAHRPAVLTEQIRRHLQIEIP